MKKISKSSLIRRMLKDNKPAKLIAQSLNVDLNRVYNERYKIKKLEESLGKPQAPKPAKEEPKTSPELASYVHDLMEIRRQIENFQTIEAFLRIRIQQMEQNAKWTNQR